MKRRRKRKQLGGFLNYGYMSGSRPPPIFGGYKWDRYGNMVSIGRQRGGLVIARRRKRKYVF